MVVDKNEIIKNRARISDLLEKLRKKLIGLDVINLKSQDLGILKDFVLDKSRRLYMVIPQSPTQADSPVYLLSTKYIQKVETSNRVILVDISLTRFHQLPLYNPSNYKLIELPEDAPRPSVAQKNLTSSGERQNFAQTQHPFEQSLTSQKSEKVDNQSVTESDDRSEVVEEQTVPLLEERLIVNRSKRKVGEIVVRKKIETRILEVPIQIEKLIIDQVGSESQQPIEVERLPVEQISKDKVTNLSGHSPTPLATDESITSSGESWDMGDTQFTRVQSFQDEDHQSLTESDDKIEVVEEEIIRLLEERLIINRSKWKVGEVVARKEVETKIVQVPIRREIIIIEQVSPETKQIAEIDLGQGGATRVELSEASSSNDLHTPVPSADTPYTVIGEFISPKAASNLLEAIALQKRHGCQKVRVELVVESPDVQETYQNMFDRCSIRSVKG